MNSRPAAAGQSCRCDVRRKVGRVTLESSLTPRTLELKLSGEMVSDGEEDEAVARDLIEELETVTGVVQAQPMTKPRPDRAKGEEIAWANLLVTVASSGAFASVVHILMNWLTRDRSRSIEMKIGENSVKLTSISEQEQRAAFALFETASKTPSQREDAGE